MVFCIAGREGGLLHHQEQTYSPLLLLFTRLCARVLLSTSLLALSDRAPRGLLVKASQDFVKFYLFLNPAFRKGVPMVVRVVIPIGLVSPYLKPPAFTLVGE